MRKKLLLGLLALVLTSGVVVFGNSPGFLERIAHSVSGGVASLLSSDEKRAWEIVAKAGRTKRSARKGQVVPHEVPESMLWHVAFDFTRKIEAKAAESVSESNDGLLFRNYFVRQGPLSATNDKLLKGMAAEYFAEVDPIEQRARTIIEGLKTSPSRSVSRSPELDELKSQKDAAALRNRDKLKNSFSQDEFNAFEKFLRTDFSEGAVSGIINPFGEAASFSPQGIFFEGWSWIIWDDAQQPPLITGFSELYFYYFFPIAPYDPSLDSFFVNATAQSLLSAGSSDGYRDWFPAQVFHPVFISVRGSEYCTLTDFYAVLYDGPVLIDEIYLDSNGVCHVVGAAPPTPSPTPTPNVASVTFSQVNPSTEGITPNPTVAPHNPGIGQRIFPDKDFPNEDPNVTDRRLVRVTATLSQPIANVPVYFRNFDLDDPATDPTIDTNGTGGNDNLNDNTGVPPAGQLQFGNGCGANGASVFCPTDANGVATIVFRVSRQPGNNFAVAASISPFAVNGVVINGIELNDSGGQPVVTQNCPTQAVCRSQMLTVWRRLHIEVDSMGTASQNLAVGNSATFARVRAFSPAVTLNVNTANPLEVNRFENGRIVFGSNQLRVVSNTATSVSVTNTLPGPNPVTVNVGAQFQLYDDDDFDNDNGNIVTGDTGEDIDPPDLGYLQSSDIPCDAAVLTNCNIFAQAYVTPLYDVTTDVTDNHFFQTNVDENTGDAIRSLFTGFNQQATEASEEFWTVYLLAGYQYTIDRDGDPRIEWDIPQNIFAGVTDVQNGMGSIVFMETNGPKECEGIGSFCIIADTAAHEIGHQANADHGEGGIMDGLSNSFSPLSLSNIRNSTHP